MTKSSDSPENRLVGEIRKAASLLDRDLTTPSEFVGKIFNEFAHADTVYAKTISSLWASVPASAQAEFTSALRAASSPEFQWRPFYLGSGPTEDDLARGTQQIRAWSAAMLQFHDN